MEDKLREIGSMAQIYSNAYITILASNADDAAHGFLAHRDTIDAPSARIPFRLAPKIFGSVTARKLSRHSSSVKSSNPLGTRAWALQEQMMANRILAYTKYTLEWRCASGMMNLNNSLHIDWDHDPVPKLISQLDTDPEVALSEWLLIVQDYSHRAMSLESDKLPAIAALAERFSAVLGHYYAGLWRYNLIKQLCWVSNITSQKRRAGSPYRAPSWSWASVNGIFLVDDEGEEDCCNFVSAVVLPKNAEIPYGEVIHASIKICGRMFLASVPRPTGTSYQTCTLIHNEGEIAEPPLQSFYKTYFHQDTKSAGRSPGSEFAADLQWDYEGFRSDPSIVCEF